MALINKNVSNVEPSSFDVLPAGNYPAQITASDVKMTKAGTGFYLSLEFTIIGEKFNGRKVWTNLNLDNPNPKAVKIAEQQLATICDCIGHSGNVQDSQELHMKPLIIGVTVKSDPQHGEGNKIKSFSNINGDVSNKSAVPQDPIGQPAPPQAGLAQAAPPVSGSFIPPGMK